MSQVLGSVARQRFARTHRSCQPPVTTANPLSPATLPAALGAGGATCYAALQRADAAWRNLRTRTVSGPRPTFVRETGERLGTAPEVDVAVCGGTLGIFLACSLQLKGAQLHVQGAGEAGTAASAWTAWVYCGTGPLVYRSQHVSTASTHLPTPTCCCPPPCRPACGGGGAGPTGGAGPGMEHQQEGAGRAGGWVGGWVSMCMLVGRLSCQWARWRKPCLLARIAVCPTGPGTGLNPAACVSAACTSAQGGTSQLTGCPSTPTQPQAGRSGCSV